MDLSQEKLTKSEWEYLEIPVDRPEHRILKLIYNGYDNTEITENDALTLLLHMKINYTDITFHYYLYNNYFKKNIEKLNTRYSLEFEDEQYKKTSKKKIKLKTKDAIRIKNSSQKIDTLKSNIYEFILLKHISTFLKKDLCPKTYFTITQLLNNSIVGINIFVKNFIDFIIEKFESRIDKYKLIKKAYTYIEKNKEIFRFDDIKLYEHQNQLFKTVKRSTNKLILYQAPTGTGKTMSPIGLAKGKKVIFTCAAKHIGLQLAKACISMEIPIAIAFGCKDPGDIRLHYFAAKDFVRHRRTGQIFRVDNSNGEKVQVIITDIQSYQSAMNYMLAFFPEKDIVWYWDEPTITLDYEDHEFHKILEKNWKQNCISNVVLSSATLPDKEEISQMLYSFQSNFANSEVFEIKSYECKKSIPILDKDGNIIMPHKLYDNFKELKKCARYIENNKTILRHLDVKSMVSFICYVNKNNFIKDSFKIDKYFKKVAEINIINLKIYYLRLLTLIKTNFADIYNYFQEKKEKPYESVIKITTNDSHTLTDGPTIFITEDVEKVALFYLKVSQIPENELDEIKKIISKNQKYILELEEVEKEENQRKDKMGSEQLDKDHSKNKDKSTEYALLQKYTKKVEALKARIISIELKSEYVPNSKNHQKKWNRSIIENAFKSDVNDQVVEEIMYLNVANSWKILLLMGIGVFLKHSNKQYMDIMKKLASEQKLYLIIASSDYIYGTNYQFCHGYLSKNLKNMTQEKMIQAFGRVGRTSSQNDYTLRIRDDELIKKLYTKDENKPEVRNMNRLFVF